MVKLYHGTSGRFLNRILKSGIQPRRKGKSNWKGNPSHPEAIYLTNAYAIYYANAVAVRKDDLIVLEVDTNLLNPFAFGPDEDALEQLLRNSDGIEGNMTKRTRYYRGNLTNYQGELDFGPVAASLTALGNCVYFGEIPVEAISRYAVISIEKADRSLLWQAVDPTITVMNYKICGTKYRNMIQWLFDEELESGGLVSFNLPESRDGITIINHQD